MTVIPRLWRLLAATSTIVLLVACSSCTRSSATEENPKEALDPICGKHSRAMLSEGTERTRTLLDRARVNALLDGTWTCEPALEGTRDSLPEATRVRVSMTPMDEIVCDVRDCKDTHSECHKGLFTRVRVTMQSEDGSLRLDFRETARLVDENRLWIETGQVIEDRQQLLRLGMLESFRVEEHVVITNDPGELRVKVRYFRSNIEGDGIIAEGSCTLDARTGSPQP